MCQQDQCVQFETWFLKKWVIKQTQVLRKSISGYLIYYRGFLQWSYEKFAILSMKPWSHFGILTYRMWSIDDITGITRDVVLHWHLPECWVANVLRQKFHLVAIPEKHISNLSVNLQVKVYLQSFWPAKLIFAWSRAFFGWPHVGKKYPMKKW